MVRKIVLNLALSLDGFIADKEGGYSWIAGDGGNLQDSEDSFDFYSFLANVDTIIMGRKAYEDCPKEAMDVFSSKEIYVLTKNKNESEYLNVRFIGGDVLKKILKMKNSPGKDIWLYGGGAMDLFVKEDVVDEYIIGVIPTILGSGRRLFLNEKQPIKLKLKEITSQEGIIVLKYSPRE